MLDEARLYGECVNIDQLRVSQFWENRSIKNLNPLRASLLGDDISLLATENRNRKECDILKNSLKNNRNRVIEIGCGTARWLENLVDVIVAYDGIDYIDTFIEQNKLRYPKEMKNYNFFTMSATDLDLNILSPPYDITIVTGVMMYINDIDIKRLFENIKKLTAINGIVYLQESVSVMNKRLTLKNFSSKNLNDFYSVIYRMPEEYEKIIYNIMPEFNVIKTGFLLDEEIGARKETNAQYWVLEKLK